MSSAKSSSTSSSTTSKRSGREDRDYYINSAMIDMLQAKGADSALLAMLRGALGTKEEVDILWVDTEEDYEDDEDGDF